MSNYYFVTCLLLAITFGCCPNERQLPRVRLGETGEMQDCLEKGVPLLAAQLSILQGPPDRVVEWAELDLLLKNEAGLSDAEIGDQKRWIRKDLEHIRRLRLHGNEDGDMATRCKFLLYDWQRPFETFIDDGILARRVKGTSSHYYVEYNGQIIDSGLIYRSKPEHSN